MRSGGGPSAGSAPEEALLPGDSTGTPGNSMELGQGRVRLDMRKMFFTEGGQALEQAPQRSSHCTMACWSSRDIWTTLVWFNF